MQNSFWVIAGTIALIIYMIFGIWIFFSTLSNLSRIIKEAKKMSNSRKTSIKSITLNDLSVQDISDYFSVYSYIETEVRDNRLNINLVSLGQKLNAATTLAAWKVLFREKKVKTILSFLIFIPIPVGWVFWILWIAVFLYLAYLAGQFEKEVKDITMENLKNDNPMNTSLSDEIVKLNDLKLKGLLTEEEFNSAKRKLMK